MVEYAGKLPWDQSTFTGRLNYYARVTDLRLMFATSNTLNKAKDIVTASRWAVKRIINVAMTTTWNREGITLPNVTKDEAIRARVIYNSAYHPDTGDKMNVIGRMSAQVPCGMVLIGGMMVFYKYAHNSEQLSFTILF